MVGEKISSNSPENLGESGNHNGENLDYPTFDPERAQRLRNEAKQKNELPFDPALYASESEWCAAHSESANRLRKQADAVNARIASEEQQRRRESVTDARVLGENGRLSEKGTKLGDDLEVYGSVHVDRRTEIAFLRAAADMLCERPDSNAIDYAMFKAEDDVNGGGSATVAEALSKVVEKWNDSGEKEFSAVDLQNAFANMAATYVASKDEKIERGMAKGLLAEMEMRLASAPVRDLEHPNLPNRGTDALRMDLSIIKPIAKRFIDEYGPQDNERGAFRKYLQKQLDVENIHAYVAGRRGERVSPESERKKIALEHAVLELNGIEGDYDERMKVLNNVLRADVSEA